MAMDIYKIEDEDIKFFAQAGNGPKCEAVLDRIREKLLAGTTKVTVERVRK